MAQMILHKLGIFSGKSTSSEIVAALGVQMESTFRVSSSLTRLLRCSFASLLLFAVFLSYPARPDASPPRTPPPDSTFSIETFAARFRAMAAFTADSIPHGYIALGDVRGYVHVLKKKGAGFVPSWSTFSLGSPVKEVLADDIDADGFVDLVVVTTAGRMFVFDTNTHQMVWENTGNDFESVSTLVIEQLDRDPAKELILLADSKILVMDGEKMLREYQSADTFDATEYMVVGDVDNDGEREIVLNSGFVLNARTLNIEWQTDFFGTRLALRDVDGDKMEELICESTGGALTVYDLDTRQEKSVF